MHLNCITLASFFFSIYRFLTTHRRAFFVTVPLVFALLAYWASRIRFEEDITKLIPTSEGSGYITEVLESVKFADKTVINISAAKTGDLGSLQEYADAFATAMTQEAAPYMTRLQVRLEADQLAELMDLVASHLPLFLDENDYHRIDSLLHPDSVAASVDDVYRTITNPQNFITTPFARQDPLGLVFLGLQKFQRLQSGGHFTLEDGYLIGRNRKNLLAFITSSGSTGETAKNAEFIQILDQTIQQLNAQFEGRAHAEYVGATAIAVANAQQIKRDIQLTLSIALVLLVTLFIYFYRRVTIPLIILFPAIFGSLLGMSVLYWLKGTISAISIGIGSVLLGLTLDYSLHILSHYRGTGDIRRLFESTTKPLLMCAVLTAVDFLCLIFLHSDVLKDLGIFAAVSVLGAAVFALVFIPQVYAPTRGVLVRQHTFIDAIARYDFSRNKWILGLGILLTLASLFTYQRVGFNDDLAALNYEPEHLKLAERRLDTLANYSAKSIYLVAYGSTYNEAADRNTRLYSQLEQQETQGNIQSFQSVGGVALSADHQRERISQWNQFWSEDKKERLKQQLLGNGRRVGFKDNTFQPFFETLSRAYSPLDTTEQTLLNRLFLEEFVSSQKNLTTITSVVKTDDSLAAEAIQSLASEDAGILAIDRKHLQEKLLGNLESDFNTLFFIASIAVFVVTFLFFGSLEITLVTNIPIFLGWLVTLGVMGVLGIQFNAFNIIITTLIFGLGVDYSIFVTKGLLEQYTYGSRDLPAYKAGVVMSALATLLCFGILIFAKHPAIRSISVIPLIGLLVVVLMSFSLQPWLFRTFIAKPQEQGNTPWRIVNLILTGLTFGYFFLGGLILSLLSQLFIAVIPISKKKKFAVFHRALQLFFHNLMYRTPGVRMEVVGQHPSNYAPPVILIANHTSILDTPTVGLLHAKQIFMMNDRQFRSPFFGRAMRMVGAPPASENHPDSLVKIRKKIEQGYSIIIFPEGTRSMTTTIQRFHKGAFYLAEQLKLDILPLLVHGNAHALPKNDNMLKPGPITLKYLPRIKYDDPTWGRNYAERAKRISAYFKAEFRALRNDREPADYFKKKLQFNFVYKPRHIQRAVRTAFNAHKEAYHQLLRHLPTAGRFLHLGCGYGVLDFLLVYDSAERQVTAWDSDQEKVLAAQHTYTANRYALQFVTDIPPLNGYDVLMVSGTLSADWMDYAGTATWVVLEGNYPDASTSLQTQGFQLVFENDRITGYRK